MRTLAALFTLSTIVIGATAVSAQLSVGPQGIRSGNTLIDASGIHTNGTDVTSSGVRSGRGSGTIIRTNGGHRSINCGGGMLTVDGNSNHLAIRDCRSVTLNGNVNELDASFTRDGRLAIMGNRNIVRWSAGPKIRVAISNPGTRNVVMRQ